jgi:hypothetical protein
VIIVITYRERNKWTGQIELLTSHGYDNDTGRLVVLPQVDPVQLGATYDTQIGEYIL